MLKFTKDLKTNVEIIDEQHKILIKYINLLLKLGTRAAEQPEIEKSLQFLGNYVIKHFADEEALQAKNNYPRYETHHSLHAQFMEDYKELVKSYNDSGASKALMLQVNRSVVAWVIHHIQEEDILFANFVRSHKIVV